MPAPRFAVHGLVAVSLLVPPVAVAAESTAEIFKRDIAPILERHCHDCHGGGSTKGGVAFDGAGADVVVQDHGLWLRALKNVRLGMMPPAGEDRVPAADLERLTVWIKRQALGLDPAHPDPGRATVRRLNRVEYRNSIRELLGVEFDTAREFPADDTGHGFDNIADVLTISPMLLEKYLDAAQTIVTSVVPSRARVVAEVSIVGKRFVPQVDGKPNPAAGEPVLGPPSVAAPAPPGARELSYYRPLTFTARHHVAAPGRYQLTADLRTVERFDDLTDYNRCRLLFFVDGELLLDREFVREGDKPFRFSFERDWRAGEHVLSFEIRPVLPATAPTRLLRVRLNAVTVRGPDDEKHWVRPPGYSKYFPRAVPAGAAARERYARALLTAFATRAFRRPVDASSVDELVGLAQRIAAQPGGTFEAGIGQAMVGVLASPRFIFREEQAEPLRPGEPYPLVDEYALASRLSYFFWSSMPDARLFRLARQGRLRKRLGPEVARLLASPRAEEFVRNFAGQWLQARDIAGVQINAFAVYLREHPDPGAESARDTFRRINKIAEEDRTAADKAAFALARDRFQALRRAPKPELTTSLRVAMQRETELTLAHVLREDRSLLELIDSDYTFLNEELAKHYGIVGVTGAQMRKVKLPADSPRGGVLTQGTVLAVTSNPSRTSPVKRGVFILSAILGTPPAPPPPNIPALEDAASREELRKMSLRETLDLHAKNPLCRSCHNRMDPLGLALENFNALGMWRDQEMNRPVEPGGKLATGESFNDIRALKRVLATDRRRDYYYNVTEKLLTYALGRGPEYTDVDTVDALVAGLERKGGRPVALLNAIVCSAPFQQQRAGGQP